MRIERTKRSWDGLEERVVNLAKRRAASLLGGMVLACAAMGPVARGGAADTAFTYQGQLKRSEVPLNGQIDARFSLWLSPAGQDPSDQIGSTVLHNAIEVANGLFSVDLDFGQDAFNGNARWLQIEIHDHDDSPGAFTTLSPRQALTPIPYALQTRGIVVTDGGKVGIGTKTPAGQLHVFGDILFEGYGGARSIIGREAEGTSAAPSRVISGAALALFGGAGYDGSTFSIPQGFMRIRSAEPWTPTARAADMDFFTTPTGSTTRIQRMLITNDGNVGIGTAAPTAKLDVRGDIRLGSTGQFFAPGGEENLRIIRGRISATGTISGGSGFTVSQTGVGSYDVMFTSPFTDFVTVTATAQPVPTGVSRVVTSTIISVFDAKFQTFDADGAPANSQFHFIAIGPR